MDYQEYFKCYQMTYRQYCTYLQNKYGIPKSSYYSKEFRKNRIGRTTDGLFVHHICEDIAPNLSNKEVAQSQNFEYQLPENLCYCDYLEHLFLHILITEYPDEETGNVVGIGGSVNYLIPELNSLFSGYSPAQPGKRYIVDCFNRVRDDFATYKYLIGRFLGTSGVPRESLVSAVMSGDSEYFNENSKIYAELKNVCDSETYTQLHNVEVYKEVENLLNTQSKALLVLGTAIGKTSVAVSYAVKYKCKVLVVCPKNNIKDTWDEFGCIVDTISYASFANKADTFDYSDYNLIVFDEVHHANAPVWGNSIRHILQNNINVKILGLTATPSCDGGRKNISDIFFKDCTVIGYDAIDGIRQGVLHPVSYVCAFYTMPKDIDNILEKCEESTDELTMKLRGRLDLALNNTPTLKEIITSNMPYGNRKGIIFVQTIEDMDEAIRILKGIYPRDEYRKIHSLMDKEEICSAKKWFSNTSSGYLCTVDMVSEGSHYRGVNTIFMFRKTCSENLFKQQLGRCMTQTSLPNPHCIVFDLVNNMRNVKEFTQKLADAIKRHGIVGTLRGERQVNPDLLPGGVEVSEQYIVEDYTQDIVDAHDELNRLLGGFWTEEEDSILKELYPAEGAKGCQPYLPKRNLSTICARASLLNLVSSISNKNKRWTQEEDNVIRELYSIKDTDLTHLIPGRSKQAIQQRASILGVKAIDNWTDEEMEWLQNNSCIYTVEEMAERLGKGRSQIKRALKKHDLKALLKINEWTKEEDDTIREFYPSEGGNVYLRLKDRTYNTVMGRASALGVRYINEKQKGWTEREDSIIKENYAKLGGSVVKLLPGRTYNAIILRASILGVRRRGRKSSY